MKCILVIFFIIMGSAMLIKPNIIWKIAESWKVKGSSTPTKFYIIIVRIGGCILLLGSVFLIFEIR